MSLLRAARLAAVSAAAVAVGLSPVAARAAAAGFCPPPIKPGCAPEITSGAPPFGPTGSEIFAAAVEALLDIQQADDEAPASPTYPALLSLYEGLRLADCLHVYRRCYEQAELADERGAVCAQVEHRAGELSTERFPALWLLRDGGPWGVVHSCFSGSWEASSSELVQAVVANATHWLAEGVRDILERMNAQARTAPMSVAEAKNRPGNIVMLLHPAEHSPGGICDPAAFAKPLFQALPGRPPGVKPWRDVAAHWTAHLGVDEVLDFVEERGHALSRFAINLGAARGECMPGLYFDPANCLFWHRGYSGIAFEGDRRSFPGLRTAFRNRPDVQLVLNFTSPAFAAGRIRDASPASPDLLKIDLDNCDVCFIEEILAAGVRPKLIHVEIDDAPPPFVARFRFQDKAPFFHARTSLSAYIAAARPYGYVLLHVEFINAVLIHRDYAALLPDLDRHSDEEKWRIGYFCHTMRATSLNSPATTFRGAAHFDTARLAAPTSAAEERLELLRAAHAQIEGRGHIVGLDAEA